MSAPTVVGIDVAKAQLDVALHPVGTLEQFPNTPAGHAAVLTVVQPLRPQPVGEYLAQLDQLGEHTDEYQGIYGFSLGQTEPRMLTYEYPPFDFPVAEELTNFEMPENILQVPHEPALVGG
jgi:hypothetical protein